MLASRLAKLECQHGVTMFCDCHHGATVLWSHTQEESGGFLAGCRGSGSSGMENSVALIHNHRQTVS